MQIANDDPQLANLTLYQSWPRFQSTKVPSLISYSRTTTGKLQWGHDIDRDSVVMRWTKLELQPQKRVDELERLFDTVKGLRLMSAFQSNSLAGVENDIPSHLGLDSEDIVADFLRKVTRRWFDHMQGDAQSVLANIPLDLVITHPGVSQHHDHGFDSSIRAIISSYMHRSGRMKLGTRP